MIMLDESRIVKFNSRRHAGVAPVRTIPGHFATNHSHINYYIDMTFTKSRVTEAKQADHALAQQYMHNTIVDTIVCLDGTKVIGAFLAQELMEAGFLSMNTHQSIYVIQPEYVTSSQMLFRDNVVPMVKNKNVILLMASVSTGVSVRRGAECVDYYGGILQGVSCLFSAVDEVVLPLQKGDTRMTVNTLFCPDDIPGYSSYSRHDCPFCKKGHRVEALVNSFGYSEFMV